MVIRCFRKEIVPASFSAEAQTPMGVIDETKLSPAVCAAVLRLGHETLADLEVDGTTRQIRATGSQTLARGPL
jgi:hypothetical protein